jgi:L-rhamnose mutarotase
MQRVCFLLQIRPERLDEYKERHRAVWPEMLEALHECGWRNYSLFVRPDGLLVGYLETEDFSRAQVEMSKREVNTRWQREMSEFFLSPAITRLEEVFHL